MVTSSNAPAVPPAKPASILRELREIAIAVGLGLLFANVIQTLLFQAFTIPSSSMEPGLVTGDYVVTSKFAYGWSRASLPFNPPLFEGRVFGRVPDRGDVVVFRLPRDPSETWVKRVIGLPGDRVQVRGGVVFINGEGLRQTVVGTGWDHDVPDRSVTLVRETLPEGRRFVTYDGGPGSPGDDTEVLEVPAGYLLMLGDNRDNSLDGRWPADVGVGLLPMENIMGRAEVVAASWQPGSGLFKPWTWLNLQTDRFFLRVR